MSLINLIRDSAASFFAADLDDDKKLSFTEFKTVLPKHICDGFKESTLQEVFNDADTDRDGFVSRTEFFFWTLRTATEQGGKSSSNLERCFGRYGACARIDGTARSGTPLTRAL